LQVVDDYYIAVATIENQEVFKGDYHIPWLLVSDENAKLEHKMYIGQYDTNSEAKLVGGLQGQ
jgi:hypothetical protein